MDGDNTAQKQGRTKGLLPAWKPGQSGNPAGRPKGSRNKLSEEFFADVLDVWTMHGKAALEKMATNETSKFVMMVASLIPRHFEFEPKHPYAELTDEELVQRIREIDAQLAHYLGG